MGYNLNNKKGHSLRFNLWVWPSLLEMAFHYGWDRQGTKNDTNKEWDGSYLNNAGYVTPEDAINMAGALERALADIPDIELKGNIREAKGLIIKKGERLTRDSLNSFLNTVSPGIGKEKGDLLSMFSGAENKAYIKNFIAFCREGGFDLN